MNKGALLFFLGAAASVSGRPDDICPRRGNSPFGGLLLPDGVSVDCLDVESSLDAITKYLTTGETSSFGGNVLSPSDGGDYDSAAKQYASARVATSPSYIVEAMDEVGVQAAVLFAGHCDYELTIRSGGHNYIGISSCEGTSSPCLQLDVRNLNHIEVLGSPRQKQIRAGPGTLMKEFADVCVEEKVFVPAGECDEVALGGHIQTGGFGVWGRTFGPLTNYVALFKIVLADGSLHTMTKPQDGTTDKFNNDLWFAVLGGASGSYGVVVDIVLDTIDESEYYAVYWEVNFVINDSTLPGIIQMLRKYADMIGEDLSTNDTRWNVWWTVVGAKKLLQLNPRWPPGLEFNYLQVDFNWAARRGTPGFVEEDERDKATDIYNSLLAACDGCLLLDDFFELAVGCITGEEPQCAAAEGLKSFFPSTPAIEGSISQMYRDVTLFAWESFQLEENNVPFKTSFQQGPNFPDADGMEEIVRGIDALLPKDLAAPTDARVLIAQLVTFPSKPHVDSTRALPFQEDPFGVVFDVWDFTGSIDYAPAQRALQDKVIAVTGGLDHRMFWAAYDEPCLTCGDWELYFDSRPKYNKLSSIKRCVDPDNLFKNRMSMPVTPLNDK